MGDSRVWVGAYHPGLLALTRPAVLVYTICSSGGRVVTPAWGRRGCLALLSLLWGADNLHGLIGSCGSYFGTRLSEGGAEVVAGPAAYTGGRRPFFFYAGVSTMAKMSTKTVADVTAKWQRNLSGATESIRQGVMGVTSSPTEAAARRQDAYVAGVQRAAADGKWARGLRRVSTQQWQEAFLQKGLPRIAQGASQGKDKVAEFMSEWLPYEQQLQQKLQSMPRGDLSTNIQRAVTAIEHNAAFRRR